MYYWIVFNIRKINRDITITENVYAKFNIISRTQKYKKVTNIPTPYVLKQSCRKSTELIKLQCELIEVLLRMKTNFNKNQDSDTTEVYNEYINNK